MIKRLVIIITICLLLQASSFAENTLDVRRPMSEAKASNASASNLQHLTSNAQRPTLKGYSYNLKRLLGQAEANIQKVKEELKNLEIRQRNEDREAKVVEHFERGNQLYQAGNLKQAEVAWQKAVEISQDPEMKDYIKESEKRAKEEEIVREKEEQQRQRKLAAETNQRERLEKERQKQLELEKKEQERLEREIQVEFEKQEKEKARAEAETRRREALIQKERERQQKIEQARLEKQQKKETLARKKAKAESKKQR